MFRSSVVGLVIGLLLLGSLAPAAAQDSIQYVSQPDEVAIFLNDIAYARDAVTLPGGVAVQVVLPATVYADTLILKEDGRRVPNYRLLTGNTTNPYTGSSDLLVAWESGAGDARAVTLEYLMSGLTWQPKYDMFLTDADTANATTQTVGFDFFAQIDNRALQAEQIAVKLVAGRVDTAQQLDAAATITANQYIAGYVDAPQDTSLTGAATIQHIYDAGTLTAAPGEKLFTLLTSQQLGARRLLLWNASSTNKVSVIYKVQNDSPLPLAEGSVRAYQDDMFLGSDFIELTPIGSEGSVTVGTLQNVRVNREVTVTALSSIFVDSEYEVVLKLENFGDEAISIEVVDYFPPDGVNFIFSAEPLRDGDNLLRWDVTIPAGENVTIAYQYQD